MGPYLKEARLFAADRCLCGSNKAVANCCLRGDGKITRRTKWVSEGDKTKINKKCHANFLGGCSNKITREHTFPDFMKRTPPFELYDPISKKINSVYPHAVYAKVLCYEHNSMFGAISDQEASRLYKFIMEYIVGKLPRDIMVNGYAIELFLLQRMCACHYGGLFTRHGSSKRHSYIDEKVLHDAIRSRSYLEGCGLHVSVPPSHFRTFEEGSEMTPIYIDNELIGIRMSIGPVSFINIIKDAIIPEMTFRRPKAIHLYSKSETHNVFFSWDKNLKL